MSAAFGFGEFVVGALLLAMTFGCCAATATILLRWRLNHLSGAPRAVALALLIVGALLFAELVPLTFGVLTRGTVPVAALLTLLATARLAPAGTSPVLSPGRGGRARVNGSVLLAAVALVATAVAWLAYLEVAATVHVNSVDALGFHFPGVIRFIQTGTLWRTTQYLPGQAQGNYPQYGDILILALALPWHSLALVRYVDPPLLAIAGVAIYAIARELRAPAPTAALAALALIAIRPTVGPVLRDVLTDPAFLAGFSAGTLFLLRHWRTGRRSELALAGLGLGIALGTKWYGLADVPILVAAWVAVALFSHRPPRRVARDAALLVGAIALAGGIWLARNLILTGNPVFDYKLSLFGITIFPAPANPLRSNIGFTLAHYIGDWSVIRRYVWPVFRTDFGVTGAMIVGGAALCAAFARRSASMRSPSGEPRVAILLLAAIGAAIAYAVTPYSAQGFDGAPVLVAANTRYGVPALVLAAPLLAWSAGRFRRAALIVDAVLLACVLANLHRYVPAAAARLVTTGVLLLVAAVAYKLAVDRGAVARAAIVAVGVCAVGGLAYHYQRVLGSRPYAPPDPTVDYVQAAAPAGTRIALAGTWTAHGLVPTAPLFGPRFQNRVSYIGPFLEHRLEQYTSGPRFIAALRRGRYQLLEIGTGFPPSMDPAQARWARAAGYSFITRSPRLILMRAPDAPAGSLAGIYGRFWSGLVDPGDRG